MTFFVIQCEVLGLILVVCYTYLLLVQAKGRYSLTVHYGQALSTLRTYGPLKGGSMLPIPSWLRRRRRFASVVATLAMAAGALLSTSTPALAAHYPPWTVSHCAPALYPWSKFEACITVNGQADTIHWTSARWMIRKVNVNVYGHWSFTGYGEVGDYNHAWTYGPISYSGYTPFRIWRGPKNPVWVNWKVPTDSYVCSLLVGGWPPFTRGTVVRAEVCVKILLPRTF